MVLKVSSSFFRRAKRASSLSFPYIVKNVALCKTMLPTVLLHLDTKPIYVETKLFESSKFEQDVLEPKDHLLMLIAAAAQVVAAMKIQSNYVFLSRATPLT